MNIEGIKETIIADIKWETEIAKTGGQQVSFPTRPVTLISDELDIKINVGTYTSQIKNKELAMTMFEFILNKLVI